MYYEVHGTGEPIVFIHGGGGSSRLWTAYIEDLAWDFMVVVADSRGQGNSTDGAGPITYGRVAVDAVYLLDHLGIARAHFVGQSAGSVACLYLLIHFPDRMKTATLMGAIYNRTNYRPEAYESMKRLLEAELWGEETLQPGRRPTPITVLKKFYSAWLTGPTFTLEVLETIERPTLIVKAGRDQFVPSEVTDAVHLHIRGSELIDFPDATHEVPREKSAEIIGALRDFIARRG